MTASSSAFAGFLSTAMQNGVDITELMDKIGIELRWEWPPEHDIGNTTYLVSLAGHKLD